MRDMALSLALVGLLACGGGPDAASVAPERTPPAEPASTVHAVPTTEGGAPSAPEGALRSSEALCQQVVERQVAWLTLQRDRLLEQAQGTPSDALSQDLARVGFQRSLLQDEGVAECTRRMSEAEAQCILAAPSPEDAAQCPRPDVRAPEERPDPDLCLRLAQHLVGLMGGGEQPAEASQAVAAFVQDQQQRCLQGLTRAEVECQLQVQQLRGGGLKGCLR